MIGRVVHGDPNMPDDVKVRFQELFEDMRWSWRGLAHLLVHRYNTIDLSELETCINSEMEKKELSYKDMPV